MAPAPKCSRCGAELSAYAPGGYCLGCLLQLGLAADEPAAAAVPSPLGEPLQALKRGAVADPAGLEVGMTIGRYKLLEKVGEGGCGAVYVAEQMEPVRRRVALKVIKLGMDTQAVVARFEAERQALAMMEHPNIAKVFDAGTTATGRPYFVMELVRGIRITEYCDQNHLSTEARLDLFIKVCNAIQHAHQKGIIHRDIKPSNILVTLHDPDASGCPKVIDFGIAKATAGRLTEATVYTQLHQFVGTPAYMSPEQAEMSPDPSGDLDTRSDIYSLGVLLYELLTGATPFDAKELLAHGLDAMRQTIREKEPVRPSTRFAALKGQELTATAKRRSADTAKLRRQLEGDLDWIVMRCLEKDRTRRYETANGLAFDLKRHLNNEPVLARPPSAAYKLQKAFRRNKLAFRAATAVALALVAGIGVSTWQAIEAQYAQQAEKQARLRADAQKVEASRLLYGADMNLAQQAWEQNDIGRLRQLLEETQASPDRGFEWYYWQRQTHLALKTLQGHLERVVSVAFSPDGQRIVTGGADQTAKVWEAASGRELLTLKGHRSLVNSVAFSRDGQRIVSGSGDQTAKVWDAATGQELLTLTGHLASVHGVAFSPDGRRIVSCSGDQTAKVWEAASGRELLTLSGPGAPINSVAFCPDGQRIVTGNGDQTARAWLAAGAEEAAAWQAEERAAAQSLAGFQRERTAEHERQRLARAGDEGAIKRWLILAPIPLASGQSATQGLDLEQVEGEGRLRPKAGETRSIGNAELRWQEVAQEDYVIDFNAILEREPTYSVAYAVCYIRSEAEQHGLRMLVGSDDEAKVCLNGNQVHKSPFPRSFTPDVDEVPDIALKAGLNVLLFKVVNETYDWKGSIRFTDAQGNPVKGIQVTLDPEAKEKTGIKKL